MRSFLNILVVLFVLGCSVANLEAQTAPIKPIRLAIAGMTHGHIGFYFGRRDRSDFVLVGIYEPNHEMALRYAAKFNFDPKLIYDNLDKMLDGVKPEAVVAFGPILEHAAVVASCAPRGIHVMVEKPLSTTAQDAERMEELAKQYRIHLLTDYETSWYPTTAKSFQLVNDSGFVGEVRKVVIHDGHQGPKEIGVNKEFLEWLTDPVKDGGGALFDFGCYGANLMTTLEKGEEPISVTAVTRQFKPDVYPKVDDQEKLLDWIRQYHRVWVPVPVPPQDNLLLPTIAAAEGAGLPIQKSLYRSITMYLISVPAKTEQHH